MDPKDFWTGEMGNEYFQRNPNNYRELENVYINKYQMTRECLNEMMLKGINGNDIKVLEIGCGTGIQLETLQRTLPYAGFYGVEINETACNEARMRRHVRKAFSSVDCVEKDTFTMVMTSGLLIHIPESELEAMFKTMDKFAKEYIYCVEYYSPERREIKYHGVDGVMWADDFSTRFLNAVKGWDLRKEILLRDITSAKPEYLQAFLLGRE